MPGASDDSLRAFATPALVVFLLPSVVKACLLSVCLGSITLARFPFTDLSGDKRRPALVVSRDNDRPPDLVVCFITSVPRSGPDMALLDAIPITGLKVASVVHFDKLATLDRFVIAGKLGDAPPEWLAAQRLTFYGVFGFVPP